MTKLCPGINNIRPLIYPNTIRNHFSNYLLILPPFPILPFVFKEPEKIIAIWITIQVPIDSHMAYLDALVYFYPARDTFRGPALRHLFPDVVLNHWIAPYLHANISRLTTLDICFMLCFTGVINPVDGIMIMFDFSAY